MFLGGGFVRRCGGALAALVLAAGVLAALPLERAAAQTTQTFVGNGTQSGNHWLTLSNDYAQPFTTGSNSAGYSLRSVGVLFDIVDVGFSASSLTAGIYTDSGGSPGSLLGSLTKPSSFPVSASTQTLTFTSSGIDLSASTTYFLVIDMGKSESNTDLDATGSNSEDSGGLPGWSIGNNVLQRAWNSTGAWTTNVRELKFSLGGVVKSVEQRAMARCVPDADRPVVAVGGTTIGETSVGFDVEVRHLRGNERAVTVRVRYSYDGGSFTDTTVVVPASPATRMVPQQFYTRTKATLSVPRRAGGLTLGVSVSNHSSYWVCTRNAGVAFTGVQQFVPPPPTTTLPEIEPETPVEDRYPRPEPPERPTNSDGTVNLYGPGGYLTPERRLAWKCWGAFGDTELLRKHGIISESESC